MPRFSNASKAALATCHSDLILVCNEAIKHYDFKVLEGHRGKEAQNRYVQQGLSKVRWPNGKHNILPSLAVDLAPYPIDWGNNVKSISRFAYLAGVMDVVSTQLLAEGKITHRLRWGGDWNMNEDPRDEKFMDWGHFELRLL
jgi:peptidoglycan L-alanyl-D-glutamate endopeptidase CwlK